MKPHIYRCRGVWFCGVFADIQAGGLSPSLAYNAWGDMG